MDKIKIKRALISLSNKVGIIEFVEVLKEFEIEIISTGGTYKILKDTGAKVINITDVTGFPEMMEGRVKTLHPNIHAAILANRENLKHMDELKKMNIIPIEMVVVNLYPFAEVIKKRKVTLDEAIENIDIGGPTMIRAAAKNYNSVCVIVNPERYNEIIAELKKTNGYISLSTRKKLAIEAFAHTAEYDSIIHQYLSKVLNF